MSESLLYQHQQVWQSKPVLREIYRDWYRMIEAQMCDGKTLEIGAGTGNFKEYAPKTNVSSKRIQPRRCILRKAVRKKDRSQ